MSEPFRNPKFIKLDGKSNLRVRSIYTNNTNETSSEHKKEYAFNNNVSGNKKGRYH